MSPSMQPSPSHAAAAAACVHRWRIGRPVDGVCAAVCAYCGATRDYPANTPTGHRMAMIVPHD